MSDPEEPTEEAPKDFVTITFYLPADLKRTFQKWVKENDTDISKELRRAIRKLLEAAPKF